MAMPSKTKEQSSPHAETPVDFRGPLYTTYASVVCPPSLLDDKRQGGGLEAANDAMLTTIGRKEAVEKAGCQEWRAGIRVYVPERAIPQHDGYVHWMEAHLVSDYSDMPLLIPSADVSNNPNVDSSLR
jgi:hypothetical protein